jgi:hypothetical protein
MGTPVNDAVQVLLRLLKPGASRQFDVAEPLALFDANTRWLDALQAEELKDARAEGTRLTRKNRGWTRESLYEDSSDFLR